MNAASISWIILLTIASGDSKPLANEPRWNQAEACPLRFADFPSDPNDTAWTYHDARLVAPGHREVDLLSPSTRGMFAMRVHQYGEAVYAQQLSTKKPKTTTYLLSSGLGALTWETVAEDPQRLRSRVEPGQYRIVVRYLSPHKPAIKRNIICTALSRAFNKKEPSVLLRFESEDS